MSVSRLNIDVQVSSERKLKRTCSVLCAAGLDAGLIAIFAGRNELIEATDLQMHYHCIG